jgi:hypothetical protein
MIKYLMYQGIPFDGDTPQPMFEAKWDVAPIKVVAQSEYDTLGAELTQAKELLRQTVTMYGTPTSHLWAPHSKSEYKRLAVQDVKCAPPDARRKAMSVYISEVTVRRLDSGYVVTWLEDGEPCGSETISEKLAMALVRNDGGVGFESSGEGKQ